MSDATVAGGTIPTPEDPYALGHTHAGAHGERATGHGEGGPASKRIVVAYGFWIFLLSDIIMFAAFFAAYIVLTGGTAGGPTGRDIFDLGIVALGTALLLASSFTCGLCAIALRRRDMRGVQLSLLATGLLGAGFLALEIYEFAHLISQGYGPTRSGFLSAFFALVGLHGLHVFAGLLWLGTMMAQLWAKGFTAPVERRLLCFNLFWHALDIVWIGIFTIVYLLGVI